MQTTQFPAPPKLTTTSRYAAIWNVLLASVLSLLPVGSAARSPDPTFNTNVAPIIFNHCVKCHRPAQIASRVPLVSYDEVRPWAGSIKQKVMAREMPPWPADPNKSVKFRNDARLSQQDIDTLVAWVDAGAPKGNNSDVPSIPKFDDGWMHPQGLKPDLVVSLPGLVHLPATGEVPYVRLLVKVPFSDDRWVVASQTRPANPAVVHHMAITEIALADGVNATDLDQLAAIARQMGLPNAIFGVRPAVTVLSNPEQFDMLGMYTPGSTFEMYGTGAAKLVRGGSNMYLNFNVHYQTDGKPETDQSMIALWFQPAPPKHQLFRVPGAAQTIIANGKELLDDAPGTKAEGTRFSIPPIPPYEGNYELIGVTGYVEPLTIYQFQPHAHHRGKDFQYTVVYPDGREQIVLSVPNYDHRWQMAYEPETPLNLPSGSKLVVTAHYDNSMKNMHNPAPEKEVYFRDQNQSWDEMFSPFIQYTIDTQDLANPQQQHEREEKTSTSHQREYLEIAEAVGCLERDITEKWMLTRASEPVVSGTQSTSSATLEATKAKALGSRRYQLLGAGVFGPSTHLGEKIAVKGILIEDSKASRLNVTSLQTVATKCVK
jgi:hypothetical protein